MQKHPHQMQLRQFVPPVFVATALGTILLAPLRITLAGLSLLLITLYIIADMVTLVATDVERGWRHLQVLPVVFSVLHVSYGLGFLAGLFRFVRRWSSEE